MRNLRVCAHTHPCASLCPACSGGNVGKMLPICLQNANNECRGCFCLVIWFKFTFWLSNFKYSEFSFLSVSQELLLFFSQFIQIRGHPGAQAQTHTPHALDLCYAYLLCRLDNVSQYLFGIAGVGAHRPEHS